MLSGALEEVMLDICKWLKENRRSVPVLALMAAAVAYENNAVVAWAEGVHKGVASVLDTDSFARSEQFSAQYVALLRIAGRLAENEKKAAESLRDESLHTKLIQQIKLIMPSHQTGDGLTISRALMGGACIEALTKIISNDTQAMADACDRFVLDMFLRGVKNTNCDPVVLAASLEGVRAVLLARPTLIRQVSDDLGKLRLLLSFLGEQRYTPLCERAQMYSKHPDVGHGVLVLSEQTDENVHKVLLSIVRLITFFSERGSDDPTCKSVNEALNAEGREAKLFRLLVVPSDPVKQAVMDCMKTVDTSELDGEELGHLLKLLGTQVNIGAGETERVLASVVELLATLIDSDGSQAHYIFRTEHGEAAVETVMDVLWRNAQRRTNDDEEEEAQKTELSLACVYFLKCCSLSSEFRPFLRSRRIIEQMSVVLFKEEELHTPSNIDITIELTWIGRDVSALLQCLVQTSRLDPRKKVGFRVVSRLADVIVGRSDAWERGRGDTAAHRKNAQLKGNKGSSVGSISAVTVFELCSRETMMWSVRAMRKEMTFLDDDELHDRHLMQEQLTSLSGAERLSQFVCASALQSTDTKELSLSRVEVSDSERLISCDKFVGRLKTYAAEQTEKKRADYEIERKKTKHKGGDKGVITSAYDEVSGRVLLMRSLMTSTDKNDDVIPSIGSTGSPDFTPKPLRNPSHEGYIDAAYIVSAYFRCLFVCLEFAVTDELKIQMAEQIARISVIKRLIDLLELCPRVQCHVCAKFFRLMSVCFKATGGSYGYNLNTVYQFDLVCGVVQQITHHIKGLLVNANNQLMSSAELILCSEVASVLSVISEQVGYIRFSDEPEVQKQCVECCLTRLIPKSTVYIGDSIVTSMLLRESKKEKLRMYVIGVLSSLLYRCSGLKYNVLEAFNKAQVLDKMYVRQSFLFELLDASSWSAYTTALEVYLTTQEEADTSSRVKALPVRVLYASRVKTYSFNKGVWATRAIAFTHTHIIIIILPEKKHCSACPPEKFCPKAPVVEQRIEYGRLTRLVRGFAPQMFAFGYFKESSTGVVSEEVEVVICEKIDARDRILTIMHRRSGDAVEGRASLYTDGELMRIISKKMDGQKIIFSTCGVQSASSPRYLALFVLTEERIYELSVNMKYWFIPEFEAAEEDIDLDEFNNWVDKRHTETLRKYKRFVRVPPVQRTTRVDPQGITRSVYTSFLGPMSGKPGSTRELEVRAKQEKRQTAIESAVSRADAGLFEWFSSSFTTTTLVSSRQQLYQEKVRIAQQNLIKTEAYQELKILKEIIFHSNIEPSVSLVFGWGRNFEILFLDDMSRDLFRRHVAYALLQGASGGKWTKKWMGCVVPLDEKPVVEPLKINKNI
eukprot:GHVR01052015.1.p1 GENE.GHVR01052015.1~~GHVR01052015.1.p1  ORF type:complete len:1359 (+),score=328.89 GHVR01052015.1:1236-5312(+)